MLGTHPFARHADYNIPSVCFPLTVGHLLESRVSPVEHVVYTLDVSILKPI